MPTRHSSSTSEAPNAFTRMERSRRKRIGAAPWVRLPGRCSGLGAIDADADEIIAHPFNIARLVLDLVADRVRPLVVDPAVAWPLGDRDHLLDQIGPILILKRDQVLADQGRTRAMRDVEPLEIVNERIKISIVESRI